MQYLSKLVHFLDQQGRLTKTIDAAVAEQSHARALLRYLREHNDASKEAASWAVFGSENDSRLPKTKTVLKNQIINGILLKGVGKMRTFTECYRLYAAGYTLWRNGSTELAIPLFETSYRKAIKVDEVEVVVQTSEKLAYYFGTLSPDRQKWKTYQTNRDYYTKVLNCQREIANLYHDINAHKQVQRCPVSSQLLKEQLTAFDRLSVDLTLPPFTQYMRLSLEVEYLGETDQLPVDYLDKQQAAYGRLFQKHPVTQRLLLTQLIMLFTARRSFPQSEAALSQLVLHTSKFNRPLWQTNNALISGILQFHRKDYNKVSHFLDAAKNSKGFNLMPPQTKEQLLLMQVLNSLVVDDEEHQRLVQHWNLRIGKFVNQMDAITYDKTGDNVLIYAAEIIWYIHYKQYGKADERIEALDRYVVRHKLRRANPRYYYFSRLLAATSQGNYHPAATRRKAAASLAKLAEHPLTKLSLANPEFIPLEDLWMVVERKLS